LQDVSDLENILKTMDKEKEDRVKEFEKQWMLVEAERIKKRVEYDIRMIRETWFVNGIENYSVYFDNRSPGEPPNTIFDYFPDDFLLIIDESHMTLPQLRAMPEWDKSRKNNLIKYWFRLPSASDHRPLNFQELEYILWWNKNDSKELDTTFLKKRMKHNSHSIFLSATPSEYELQLSDKIVQQIIRPTGLLDPITSVYPKSWDYQILIDSIEKLIKEKPHLKEFLNWYEIKDWIEEVFGD
jgi:excinuclease ABC subunit B